MVTGDDKTVHLLDAQTDLAVIREITLPKRPSAITFTPDSASLLCGDKFGDVYALFVDETDRREPARKKARTSRNGVTAATNLTVHTKGNLQALEHQRKLAARASEKAGTDDNLTKDDSPTSEPILGHVSMLTDIAAPRVNSPANGHSSDLAHGFRDFILTADRDEHIRVSRGLPQSHVVEGFCLGHERFVSKMCLPRADLLVSGGGDDFLCLWDWQQSRLLAKVDLRHYFTIQNASESQERISVSGLWSCSTDAGSTSFCCACEGVPRLLHVQLKKEAYLTVPLDIIPTVVPLKGNPIGVVFLPNSQQEGRLVACLDNIHEPNSTCDLRQSENIGLRLQAYVASDHDGLLSFNKEDNEFAQQLDAQCTPQVTVEDVQISCAQMSSLLYGTEKLRKRGGEDTEPS